MSNTEMVSVPRNLLSRWLMDFGRTHAALNELKADTRALLAQPAQHQGKPAACSHEWTDDGEFLLVCTVCGAQENHDPKWRDMETAPRDGTLVRLLVEFTEHATEDSDAMLSPTIGANSFDHTGEDVWQFAGWSWEQDCFTQGAGEPIGWLPMLDTPHADPGEVERLRAELNEWKKRCQYNADTAHDVAKERDILQAGWYKDESGNNRFWPEEVEELTAQLAERDALLIESHDLLNSGHLAAVSTYARQRAYSLIDKIKAVISASAGPSESVERDERADFDTWFRKEKGLHPEADTTFIDSAFLPYRAWKARAALERKPSALVDQLQTDLTALDEEIDGLRIDAGRYRYLRSRDLDAISKGGVFAGMTPDNLVLNEETLDREIDAAMTKELQP